LVLERGNCDLVASVKQNDVSVHDLQRISFQILVGLAQLHILRFVHRDLKPANVILTGPDNTAKIIDLGSFENVDCMDTGIDLGCLFTPDYAGPEQLRPSLGPTVTIAAAYNMDSWCFGGTLLFIATKEWPWYNVPRLTCSLEERVAHLETQDIAVLLDKYELPYGMMLTEKLPPEAMEVLKAAMRWRCADRLSAAQLLRLKWYKQLRQELVQQVQQQHVEEGSPIKQLVDGWVKDGMV
jgi:serine/threonine protein kinase